MQFSLFNSFGVGVLKRLHRLVCLGFTGGTTYTHTSEIMIKFHHVVLQRIFNATVKRSAYTAEHTEDPKEFISFDHVPKLLL